MKTILYVEDNEHDVFFLKRAFAQHADGWRVENVQSVEEAISYLEGTGRYHDRKQFPSVDLIVSDVSIPGGSGYQLARWVKEHAELGHIPFVLVSGSAQDPELEKAATMGADSCLEKSPDFQELLATVKRLIQPA